MLFWMGSDLQVKVWRKKENQLETDRIIALEANDNHDRRVEIVVLDRKDVVDLHHLVHDLAVRTKKTKPKLLFIVNHVVLFHFFSPGKKYPSIDIELKTEKSNIIS